MLLEGQVFYTTMTMEEIQLRFGRSAYVVELFKATYIRDGIKVKTLETTTEIIKDVNIETTNLKEILDNFLHSFEKITTTASGGQGTAGYAMIPVRMSDGKPKRCMDCGNIILSNETVCPSCGSYNIKEKGAELDMKKWVGWDFEGTIKYMIQFLEGYDFPQITTLNNKQKKTIKEFLIASLTEGWTMNKLESEIETVTEDDSSARMIARSEVIRAANEGAILHYKEADIEKVKWIAVPSSPGGRTCPRCLEMNGKEFLLKDAEGKIPWHPFCRCCWSPIV
jgi:SPP1 gp7 family putative phage head morphogenesis protein